MRNRLLAGLPFDDQRDLLAAATRVELKVDTLIELQASQHVYFPERGVISLRLGKGYGLIEVAMVGFEGMVGLGGLAGPDLDFEALVRVPVEAWQLPRSRLSTALQTTPAIQRMLSRYAQARAVQIAYGSFAAGRLDLTHRVARSILMICDRTDGSLLSMTHEHLASSLGVRRPGVTVAFHILEGERLIRSTRGRVEVLDVEGLKQFVGAGYGAPEAAYERLFSPPPSANARAGGAAMIDGIAAEGV